MKSLFLKVCFLLLLFLATAPAATAQDFVRTQIGTVSYTSPLYQQRYNSQGFNPPLIFEVGTAAAQKNVFQIVGLTPANTHTFAFTAPAQVSVTTFPDPGAATATIPYLELAQTFSAVQTFSAANIFSVGQKFTATTNQFLVGAAAHLDTVSFTAPAAAAQTITFPDSGVATSIVPYAVFTNCGVAAACSPTTVSSTVKFTMGTCPASSATTCTVTGISPAYTSTTSYVCNVTEGTTAANNVLKITYVSGSSFTITTTSSSDVFSYVCMGT